MKAAGPIGLAAQMGGSIIKGVGGLEAGKFNAKVARYNKQAMLADSVSQQDAIRRRARQAMGEQIAAQGGAGVALGTGSALDALHDSAINEQLDLLNIRRRAQIAAQGYDIEAASAKAQGLNAMTGGFIGAVGAAADYAAAK